MERRPAYAPPPEPTAEPAGPADHTPPAGFADYWEDWARVPSAAAPVRTGRLADWLRQAVQRTDVLTRLRDAAWRSLDTARAGRDAESRALADLAVSGRESYRQFVSLRPTDEMVFAALQAVAPGLAPGPARDAVRRVLDRAYQVCWALRGPAASRRFDGSVRRGLGWIALSGEDDAPHAPVNIPSTTDVQGELTVTVPRVRQAVAVRAALKLAPAGAAPAPVPGFPTRAIPGNDELQRLLSDRRSAGYDRLVLFIHGLGSRLEESDRFKDLMLAKLRDRGLRCAVLSVDLPGFGYSTRLDLDALVADRPRPGGRHGFWINDVAQSNFPLLGYYRDVLLTLAQQIPGGIQHVVGGSLGGNLGLWLAADARMFTTLPDPLGLAARSGLRAVASWSPASVWDSYELSRAAPHDTWDAPMEMEVNAGKDAAKTRPLSRMTKPETPDLRLTDFFHLMQRGEPGSGIAGTSGWGYPPTRSNLVLQSELYGGAYRRTFWTCAYEQVTFSHRGPLSVAREWPFRTIRRPLLLLGGARDIGGGLATDFKLRRVTNIYDNVEYITDQSPDVPGKRLLLRDTGHSISDERPDHLSTEVASFFAGAEAVPVWSKVPGQARDIAIGAGGSVWIVGESQYPGADPGNGSLARWTGSAWHTEPGWGTRIAVDASGGRWVVNSRGHIYSPSGWMGEHAGGRDIGVGADGSVWVVGTDVPSPGNGGIHRWLGDGRWMGQPGQFGTRIAVGPAGEWVVVNSLGHIHDASGRRVGGTGATARDVAIGANGALWVIGTDPEPGADGNFGVHRLDRATGTFRKFDGYGVAIAVDTIGRPWVVRANGDILRMENALPG